MTDGLNSKAYGDRMDHDKALNSINISQQCLRLGTYRFGLPAVLSIKTNF